MKKNKKQSLNIVSLFPEAVPYIVGAVFIIMAFVTSEDVYFNCGFILVAAALIVRVVTGIMTPDTGEHKLSEYDKEIIGSGFAFGAKKALFYSGFEKMHDGLFDDAVEEFSELKNENLTETEQGALGFYMAVCYSRMGYPTNAGHCAATAVENEVHVPESLLLAARSFSQAGNTSAASDYYEQLLPLAEEKHIYPFIYNEMGKMYLSANQPSQSRIYFEKAIEKGLDPITSQGGLALVDLLEGRTDEACERYRLALIARISDTEGFRAYSEQICTANGYPADFFETHLREKYSKSANK